MGDFLRYEGVLWFEGTTRGGLSYCCCLVFLARPKAIGIRLMIVKILQKNRLFLSCLSGPGIIGKYVYLSPLVILVSRLTLIPLTPELRSKYFTT